MTNIPDVTDAEQKSVSSILLERYGKIVPLQLADSELQLSGDPADLTLCPTLYWNERGVHFIICKVAADRYRCQFFYSDADQYGTGRDEYDDIGICAKTLLQVQADHEHHLANVSSGATAAILKEDDYHGPLVI